MPPPVKGGGNIYNLYGHMKYHILMMLNKLYKAVGAKPYETYRPSKTLSDLSVDLLAKRTSIRHKIFAQEYIPKGHLNRTGSSLAADAATTTCITDIRTKYGWLTARFNNPLLFR